MPQITQDDPKKTPRWPKEGPRSHQEGAKRAQDGRARERERGSEREREGERGEEKQSWGHHEGETLEILLSGASACGARAERAHKHAYMGHEGTSFDYLPRASTIFLVGFALPVPMLGQVYDF